MLSWVWRLWIVRISPHSSTNLVYWFAAPGPAFLLVHLSNLRDVVKIIQSDLGNLVIHGLKQRLNASLRDEIADL